MSQVFYEAPSIWVMEVNIESIICTSGDAGPEGSRQDYGDPIERVF